MKNNNGVHVIMARTDRVGMINRKEGRKIYEDKY
jgi:hypothetical protein